MMPVATTRPEFITPLQETRVFPDDCREQQWVLKNALIGRSFELG